MLHPRHQFGDGRRLAALATPEQHVVEHQAERVDVGAMIDGDAPGLFRRHVLDGADDGAAGGHAQARAARRGPGDAEVHDQRVTFALDHDVGGFQVAMHDPGFVGGREARRHLPGNRDGAILGEPAFFLEQRRQVRSLHVRHRDVRDAVDLAEIVDANHVLVRDLAREEKLALEAALEGLGGLGVVGVWRPDDLHGDRDLEHLVPGLIDRAHPAGAEQPDDVIAGAEIVADDERTGACESHRAACAGGRIRRGGPRYGTAGRLVGTGEWAGSAGGRLGANDRSRRPGGRVRPGERAGERQWARRVAGVSPSSGRTGGGGVMTPVAMTGSAGCGAPQARHRPCIAGAVLPQREQDIARDRPIMDRMRQVGQRSVAVAPLNQAATTDYDGRIA